MPLAGTLLNFIKVELGISPGGCFMPMIPGIGQVFFMFVPSDKRNTSSPLPVTITCSKDNNSNANIPHPSSLRSTNKITQKQIYLRYISWFMKPSPVSFNEGSQMIGKKSKCVCQPWYKKIHVPRVS